MSDKIYIHGLKISQNCSKYIDSIRDEYEANQITKAVFNRKFITCIQSEFCVIGKELPEMFLVQTTK